MVKTTVSTLVTTTSYNLPHRIFADTYYSHMKICVLLGGPSAEREISLLSGSAMARALAQNGHEVTLLDPAFNKPMRLEEFTAQAAHQTPPTPEELAKLKRSVVLESLMSETVRTSDVVVLGLHGVPGEDGMVQSVLEFMGKPYTGTGSRASAVCIDKEITKILLEHHGVKTPKGVTLKTGMSRDEVRGRFTAIRDELGLPMVIKPNDQGSTVGLTILKTDDPEAFVKGVELSWMYSEKALIEEFVEGRELTVTVLGDEALPIVEINPEGGFYDYHHKYTKGMTVYTAPAEIEPAIAASIQADALTTFKALDARGYARIDFRLRPDGSFACLEINTLPGMTELSLVPKAANAAGISFTELCDRILKSAV